MLPRRQPLYDYLNQPVNIGLGNTVYNLYSNIPVGSGFFTSSQEYPHTLSLSSIFLHFFTAFRGIFIFVEAHPIDDWKPEVVRAFRSTDYDIKVTETPFGITNIMQITFHALVRSYCIPQRMPLTN